MMEPTNGGTEAEVFAAVEEIQEDVNIAPPSTPIPKFYDEAWHDYVMGQFLDNELENGRPTCDGLRRVTEKLIGPIVERRIVQLAPLTSLTENQTGAVVIKIVVAPRSFTDFERTQLVEESVSDVNKQNTDIKFFIHPMATCETKAESRCLRKILRLRKVIAAEEAGDVDEGKLEDLVSFEPDDPISEEQLNAIDIICRRLDINVIDYINAGKRQYENINQITKSKGALILQHLNKIQRSVIEKPKSVRSYDSNWKK